MRRLFVLSTIFIGLLVMLVLAGGNGFQNARPAEAVQTTSTWMWPTSGGIQAPGGGPTISTDLAPAPCTNCYITGIVPDLVYMSDPDPTNHPDGSTANFNDSSLDNVWLHHMVVVDSCNLANRIFASGNERTTMSLPAGYGYFEGAGCQWYVNYHIHNSSSATRGVALKLVVTYRTGETLTPVTPVWLDMSSAQTTSEYTVPTGYSDTHTGSGATGISNDWTSTIQGKIVAIGGHVHDYGISVSAYNNRLGDYICTSTSGYGTGSRYLPTGGAGTLGHPAAANALVLNQSYHEANGTPDDRYHIQQMAACTPTPLQSIICVGDVIRLHAQYNNASGFPIFDAMGIITAYVATNLPDSNHNGTIDACDNSDSDLDGFSDRVESFIGTDPLVACGGTALPDGSSSTWPPDMNNDGRANISDVLKYIPVFNTTGPNPPYKKRYDLNADNKINISDVLKFIPFFNQSCAP
jgi:Dockerin type I domain